MSEGRKVFVSYSRADKDKVFPLVKTLEKGVGAKFWIDLEGIESTAQFLNVIRQAIKDSQVVLFMLSDNSINGEWTQREVMFAKECGKRVVPVILDGGDLRDWTELYFANVNYVDAKNKHQIEKLSKEIAEWIGEETVVEPEVNPSPEKRRGALLSVLVGIVVAMAVGACVYLAVRPSPAGVTVDPEPVAESEKGDTTENIPAPVAQSIILAQEEASAGGINVSCGPKGATIKIDGKSVGTTPIEIEGLSVGRHQVEVSKSGYVSRCWTVSVKANGTTYLSDDLALVEEETKATATPTTSSSYGSSVESSPSSSPSSTTSSNIVRGTNASAMSGTINGHAYVELGLSVKWATCNIGASSLEDYGDYYAWGETNTKSSYIQENSKTYNNSSYNHDIGGSYSTDAARAVWGGTWRMPTDYEYQELLDNCTFIWTKLEGKKGYKVTSNKTGKSIFFPVDPAIKNEWGGYWLSVPYADNSRKAKCFGVDANGHGFGYCSRFVGLSIRPVSD